LKRKEEEKRREMTTPELSEGHRKTAEEASQGFDLTGKVAIVTGASSGLGIETARVLALRGAHVFLAVRDTKKAEPIAEQIKASTKNDKVEILQLDLGSFKSVRAFVDAFLGRKLPLHYLINNAGIMATPEGRTEGLLSVSSHYHIDWMREMGSILMFRAQKWGR